MRLWSMISGQWSMVSLVLFMAVTYVKIFLLTNEKSQLCMSSLMLCLDNQKSYAFILIFFH